MDLKTYRVNSNLSDKHNFDGSVPPPAATQAQRGHRRIVSGPRARHLCHHLDAQQPHGETGFLCDIRRMNVGMTRARRVWWANRPESGIVIAEVVTLS